MNKILTSWKTSVAGAAAAVLALGDILLQLSHGNLDQQKLMEDIAIIAAGLGAIFAKDFNVTGGTKQQ